MLCCKTRPLFLPHGVFWEALGHLERGGREGGREGEEGRREGRGREGEGGGREGRGEREGEGGGGRKRVGVSLIKKPYQ